MKSMSALAFALAFSIAACAGSQPKRDTLDDDKKEVAADTLTEEECGAMVDHIASISGEIDRDAQLADCTATGTRSLHDCVMAAEDQSTLDACHGGDTDEIVPDEVNDTDDTGDTADDTGDTGDDTADDTGDEE